MICPHFFQFFDIVQGWDDLRANGIVPFSIRLVVHERQVVGGNAKGDSIFPGKGNGFIFLINILIEVYNSLLRMIVKFFAKVGLEIKLQEMPLIPYLGYWSINPTLEQVAAAVYGSWQPLQLAWGNYWSGVQAQAPYSYARGAIAGLVTAAATFVARAGGPSPHAIRTRFKMR